MSSLSLTLLIPSFTCNYLHIVLWKMNCKPVKFSNKIYYFRTLSWAFLKKKKQIKSAKINRFTELVGFSVDLRLTTHVNCRLIIFSICMNFLLLLHIVSFTCTLCLHSLSFLSPHNFTLIHLSIQCTLPSPNWPFRYASLYFCCCVEPEDNELLTLEIIHRYVELLDKYFGSVSLYIYNWCFICR